MIRAAARIAPSVSTGRLLGAGLLVHDQPQPAQLDILRVSKGFDDVGFVYGNQMLEFEVRDIACRDVYKPTGTPFEEVRIDEIAVLADQDTLVAAAQIAQAVVWCAVSLGKVECVDRVMTALTQHGNEPARQLGIDEESHDAWASMLLTRLNFAANANVARISSRSRS